MTEIPTITTERLVLRVPVTADFEPLAVVLTSERARYMDGPFDRKQAWTQFAAAVGQWVLFGYGCWSIVDRATGAYCGAISLNRPEHCPENELGWVLLKEWTRQGVAYEAAVAARQWAYGTLGWTTLVSYIDPANAASIALAERLGARLDPDAPKPRDDPGLVYRHPSPEALR